MFTGIVEEKGTVTALAQLGDAVRLIIRGPVVTSDAAHGDSISVNGCCLTVAARDDDTQAVTHVRHAVTDRERLDDGSGRRPERAVGEVATAVGRSVRGHPSVCALRGGTPSHPGTRAVDPPHTTCVP